MTSFLFFSKLAHAGRGIHNRPPRRDARLYSLEQIRRTDEIDTEHRLRIGGAARKPGAIE